MTKPKSLDEELRGLSIRRTITIPFTLINGVHYCITIPLTRKDKEGGRTEKVLVRLAEKNGCRWRKVVPKGIPVVPGGSSDGCDLRYNYTGKQAGYAVRDLFTLVRTTPKHKRKV